MGKTFRRNSEDSYKYGGNKRPKPKPKRHPPKHPSSDSGEKEWRKTFGEINGILEDDNGKHPDKS